MQKLTVIEAMQLLAKAINKPCMYINFDDNYPNLMEISRAAPYLDPTNPDSNDTQILFDSNAILVFDNEQQMETAFNSTVGQDGPTRLNSYNGTAKVYALTCNAAGELLNENT